MKSGKVLSEQRDSRPRGGRAPAGGSGRGGVGKSHDGEAGKKDDARGSRRFLVTLSESSWVDLGLLANLNGIPTATFVRRIIEDELVRNKDFLKSIREVKARFDKRGGG